MKASRSSIQDRCCVLYCSSPGTCKLCSWPLKAKRRLPFHTCFSSAAAAAERKFSQASGAGQLTTADSKWHSIPGFGFLSTVSQPGRGLRRSSNRLASCSSPLSKGFRLALKHGTRLAHRSMQGISVKGLKPNNPRHKLSVEAVFTQSLKNISLQHCTGQVLNQKAGDVLKATGHATCTVYCNSRSEY